MTTTEHFKECFMCHKIFMYMISDEENRVLELRSCPQCSVQGMVTLRPVDIEHAPKWAEK